MTDGINSALNWNWSPSQWAAAQARYDRYIIEQHGKIRIFGQTTPKPLRDIYTDVYVLDTPTAHNRTSQEEITDYLLRKDRSYSFRHGERKPIEELLSQGTKFIILGKPGAGKTTLLRHLALREAQPGLKGHNLGKVPIFVSLKQYANAGKPLFDFIVGQFAICRLPNASPYVEALLESGGALVLYDGLDEVMRGEELQPDQRGQVAEELEQFALRYSDCHVVISSRISAINYTFHPNFTYLELADFAPDQVKQFVRHWFMDEAKPDESTALADLMLDELAKHEHEGIRDLARSPLLLTLLCLNYAKTGRFPAKRAEVYDEALDALLKTWDETRQIGRGTRYKALSLGRKRQMFACIAYNAFARNKIIFEQSELEAAILAYLQYVPELPESIDIDGEVVLQEIIAQHGIFAQQAHRIYSFSHLTFQEYYTAKYISDEKSADSTTILMKHITDGKWRDVILMTASLLPRVTGFLEDFANALMQLAAANLDLAMVLREVDKQTAKSQSGHRRPTIRSLLLIHAILLTSNSDRFRDVHRVLYLTFVLATSLDRDFNEVVTLTSDRMQNCANALDRGDLNRDDLNLLFTFAAVFRLSRKFAFDLDLDRNFSVGLALALENVLAKYLNATRLFYDCIQVANIPDRHAFEDRILEPPPR